MKNIKIFTTSFMYALIITLLIGLYFRCGASVQTDYQENNWNQNQHLNYEYYMDTYDLTEEELQYIEEALLPFWVGFAGACAGIAVGSLIIQGIELYKQQRQLDEIHEATAGQCLDV